MKRFVLFAMCPAFLLCGAALVMGADNVKLEWQSSGMGKAAGYYMPMKMTLSSAKPDGIKAVPAGLSAPLYGKLQLGPAESPTAFFVILDEPDGKPSRLFVDANANGDLADDPPAEWQGRPQKAGDGTTLTTYMGGAKLQVPYDSGKKDLHLVMYRFDKNDAGRAALKDNLFYYRDYGLAGNASLGGKTYHALLLDEGATGDFRPPKDTDKPAVNLFLGLNNNGKFDRGESFNVAKPFNVGGTTYEVASLTAAGGSFQFVKSTQTVDETKPMDDLSAGKKALSFEAKTTAGTTVHFPQDYKGKVVMLDFWATWCGPCRREIPGIVAAYDKYHSKGFDILGISLDQPNASEKLAQFTKDSHMAWPQVYDGQYLKAAVARQYSIESIPHAYIVDGDTGMILAEGDSIRGESLAPAIASALSKRQ
ncbi:MAG TPA: TlpA disulfide reductase family protein [Verrucomicrobiae bacterium]|jgi:thiol-disulfide isomerase/thioredoxin